MKRRWDTSGIVLGFGIGAMVLVWYLLQAQVSSAVIAPGLVLYLAATALAGYSYSWLIRHTPHRLPLYESITVGLVNGALMWVIFGLIIAPGLAGEGVQWAAAAAAQELPLLFIYLLHGSVLVIAFHGLQMAGWLRPITPSEVVAAASSMPHPHIVILGGGFAGVTTAQTLERLNKHATITLVSPDNHLLFTPMLAEVTAGGVEAQHITPPLRAFFHHVRIIQGKPIRFDKDQNQVMIQSNKGIITELTYDHLVLAMGSVSNYFGNPDLARYSFAFKSLADAIRIRAHVLNILEQADSEPDIERRRAMLTFVVVGAGFAGSELIGGLNDFVRGSLWYYKHLNNDDITLLLLHPADRILLELSPELAHYAEERMIARGVTIRAGARVTGASAGAVLIGDEKIATETLIWTAGSIPNPALHMLGCELNKRGAAVTDATLRVVGESNIWAVGDCAAIPDVVTGGTAPPTAQYALREAKTLAHNLHATLHGATLHEFRHHSQGSLAVVGHQTACAEVFGFKFSGLFAWLLWRGIYLSKLPTLEKKVRVLLDWVIDVFFPRDIAYAPLPAETSDLLPASGD